MATQVFFAAGLTQIIYGFLSTHNIIAFDEANKHADIKLPEILNNDCQHKDISVKQVTIRTDISTAMSVA